MCDRSRGLLKLRPVTFLYKPEYDKGDRTLQYGLIAEEVAKVYPELVAYDSDGQPYSVHNQSPQTAPRVARAEKTVAGETLCVGPSLFMTNGKPTTAE